MTAVPMDLENVIAGAQYAQEVAMKLLDLVQGAADDPLLQADLDDRAFEAAVVLHTILSWMPARQADDQALLAALNAWLP